METVSYLLPSLSSLCGEWFSWNWQESFGTVESAIAGFVKHHDLPTGCAAITEIDHLLELARSEKELAFILRHDLLCFVQRGRKYQTWTNWLRWVQTILHREVTLACSRRRLSPGLGTHTLHFPLDRSVGLLQQYYPQGVRIVKRAFSTARYRSWIQEPQRVQLIEPHGHHAPSGSCQR
jgi:hypothetical protein